MRPFVIWHFLFLLFMSCFHAFPQTRLICNLSSNILLFLNIPILIPPVYTRLNSSDASTKKETSLCNKFLLLLPLSCFWRSSSSSLFLLMCRPGLQAWRRGDWVRQPQSPGRQRRHQELGAGGEHQPEERLQRELAGAAGGRPSFPVASRLQLPSGTHRGGLLLLPRWVEGPFWSAFTRVKPSKCN